MNSNKNEPVFITGNEKKHKIATEVCSRYGISLLRQKLEIDEIQAESSIDVATAKARSAFELIGVPVVVNDAQWSIEGLGGFPGPYMKFINEWFTEEDFIILTRNKQNKSVILTDILAYYDGTEEKVFTLEHKGELLQKPEGNVGPPSDKVISLIEGKSIARISEEGRSSTTEENSSVWDEFAQWMKTKS